MAFTPAILFLDLPHSILCGIDLLSFTTSSNFHGIKDLPPGFHFIFTSETPSLSIRDGFWFHVPSPTSPSASTLLVRKWDKEKSCLVPMNDPEMYRAKFEELFETRLSPYRQSVDKEPVSRTADWEGLTEHIKTKTLQNLTQDDELSLTSASCAKEDQDLIPGLSAEEAGFEERELGVLGIDLKRTWPEGAIGRERTDAATDRSWALGDVVSRWQHHEGNWGDVILGQMESCFIMVLTIANYSCLEEWKRCLNLVLTCRKAIGEHEDFFASFLLLLNRQIERCEDVDGGLFDMSDEGGNMLKARLRAFKQTLEQDFVGDRCENAKEEMAKLENTLRKMYGWTLNDEFLRSGMLELEDGELVEMEVNGMYGEDEEYAPVIVDVEAAP